MSSSISPAGLVRVKATASRLLPLLLLLSAFVGVGFGSDPSGRTTAFLRTSSPATSAPSFRINVNAVLVNVGVVFPDGTSPQLNIDDFEIWEDGVQQKISYFAKGNIPLSVVILLDTSESMRRVALAQAKHAALQFVDQANTDTQFAVISFDSEVRLRKGFTDNRDAVKSAINDLRSAGTTRLFDGIYTAAQLLSEVGPDRVKVIVLLTDGKDEESQRGYTEIQDLLSNQDVTLFACGVYNPAYRRLFMNEKKYYMSPEVEENLNPVWVLREFARVCGTQACFPSPGESITDSFTAITKELQQRYVLGFTSVAGSGARYRHVDVRLKSGDGAIIQSRSGATR